MSGSVQRVEQGLRVPKVARDVGVLGDFTGIYCRGRHGDVTREALESVGTGLGVYERVPVVCKECREFLVYAERRRATCPHDPKPQCKNCPKHCYKPDMRETAREVMRYAGPRSVLRGHAVDAVAHVLDRPIRALKRGGDR